ncbi:MAG: hypothetical protein AAF629_08175 [Chloroflexota bacterium]
MMFKNFVAKFVVAVALMAAVAGGSGIVGDALGVEVTPLALAGDCNTGSGGGGC